MMLRIKKRYNIKKLLSKIIKIGPRGYLKAIAAASSNPPDVELAKVQDKYYIGVVGDFLFESLRSGVEHEPHFKQLAKLVLSKKSRILDLGANIGTHTIFCAKIATEGYVYSFEPQSLAFSILQSNLHMNKCTNVLAYKFAVSDKSNCVIAMDHIYYDSLKLNIGGARANSLSGLGDKCITYKVDDLINDKIDFIKIDVQGSELLALSGAKKLIDANRPILFVEIEEQHLKSLGTNSETLIDYILCQNYTLYRIITDYPCDHVCVPNENEKWFTDNILPNFEYKTEVISGKKVLLQFDSDASQIYKSISIID